MFTLIFFYYIIDVIVTGPVTTKPASKLSTELEEFMQSSGEHGVVVISFGSAIMHLNEDVLQNIIAAISRLKQKVIWKIQGSLLFQDV